MIKITVALLGSMMALWHAGMTVLYLAPANIVTNQTLNFVKSYMHPLFYQDWHLFSPNPGFTSIQLWIRCGLDDHFGPWFDPFARLQHEHYATRITGRGKLLYVYYNLPRGLDESFDKEKDQCYTENSKLIGNIDIDQINCSDDQLIDRVIDSGKFDLTARFASDVCHALRFPFAKPNQIQVKVVSLTPKKYSQRNSSEPWANVKSIEFPPQHLLTTDKETSRYAFGSGKKL